jgi:phosphoglycolate phosphatase-like HAD superfamily hydrolase
MTMIRNLIWDLDGTLLDTYPTMTQAFVAALADLGQTVDPARVDSLARQSLGYCAEVLAGETGINPEEIANRFAEHYSEVPLAQQPPFPGVVEVCRCIFTRGGMNAIITHRGRESAWRLLQEHRLDTYFADILGHEDGYPRKPDPAVFTAMVQKHHLKPEETLAIGDREIDILAGKAAGLQTCLFGNAESSTDPDLTITDFMQLYEILQAQE